MLDGLRRRALREQDLPEQVAGLGEVGLRLKDAAQQRERLVRPLLRVEDVREVLPRLQVGGVHGELGAQGRLGLRQLALLQEDDAERPVGLRRVGLLAEGLLQVLDGRVEIPHLRVGLAQQHAELGGVPVRREQLREDLLGLRSPGRSCARARP